MPAVQNKEMFHWVAPNVLDSNGNLAEFTPNTSETYEEVTKKYILEKVEKDKTLITVNAATPGVFGFDKEFRTKMGENYIDVGIAEEHAVGYCSALAKMGAKPILAFMSSFVQRTYDQLSQDLCLNNSPITMLIYWGGISSADCTHLCTFDIPLISNIPNLVYLAPTNKEEYLSMLDWSVNQTKYPVAIRVPSYPLVSTGAKGVKGVKGLKDNTDYSILNKFEVKEQGEKVAILGLGNFYQLGENVKKLLKEKFGFDATLINPKFITGIDEELLEDLKQNHKIVVTLEDGELDGGFGEKISRFYGNSSMRVLNYGAKKEFTDRTPIEELYKKYRLVKELIVEDIFNIL